MDRRGMKSIYVFLAAVYGAMAAFKSFIIIFHIIYFPYSLGESSP